MATTSPIFLPQRLALLPMESAAEYLSRLAWANGFLHALEFGSVTGLKQGSLLKMADADASWLGDLTGLSKDELGRFATPSGTIIPFGQASVKRSQLQTTGVRYCPACVKQDLRIGTPYIRGPWKWRMIARCPEHGCLLEMNREGTEGVKSFDALAHAPCEQVIPQTWSSDRYFWDRLTREAGDSFLDAMPAYVAAEFCTLLGHLASTLHGAPFKERIPDGFENADLRQKGYEIAAQGRDVVVGSLETIVLAGSKRIKGPMDMFGSVLYWASVNKHNSDYTDTLRLFQEVVEDNIPLAPGDAFIWPIKKRKVFFLSTASTEYGISEERVERVLASKFGDAGVPRFLKREEVHAVLLEASSYITTSEAAKLLGCSIELCDLLIKRGYITAMTNNEGSARVFRLIHKNEIAAFLRQLEGRLSSDPTSLGDFVAYPDLIRMRAYRAIDLVELVLEGAITQVALAGEVVRFASLLFDMDEIRSVFKTRDALASVEEELLDARAAGRRLGVKKSAIDELVEREIIPSRIIMVSGRAVARLSTIDLDQFGSEHITASQLATSAGIELGEMLDKISAASLAPVVEGWFAGDRFYKKIDITELGIQ